MGAMLWLYPDDSMLRASPLCAARRTHFIFPLREFIRHVKPAALMWPVLCVQLYYPVSSISALAHPHPVFLVVLSCDAGGHVTLRAVKGNISRQCAALTDYHAVRLVHRINSDSSTQSPLLCHCVSLCRHCPFLPLDIPRPVLIRCELLLDMAMPTLSACARSHYCCVRDNPPHWRNGIG